MTAALLPESHVIGGWGGSIRTRARLWRPRDVAQVREALTSAAADGRSLCLRGSGRSYGDASILSHGDVLDMRGMDRILSFDPTEGVIEVEPGVTIARLWRHVVGHGFWPAVVPGTMFPTIGGCVAMNIHGKNHFKAGGFGEHVLDLDVVLPSGELRTIDREADADLFHSVVGGFGLLGVVTRVRLRLKRIHSGLLEVTAFATSTLQEMVEQLLQQEEHSDYLVGWVDCFDGRARGVVHQARNLAAGEDPMSQETLRPENQDVPGRIMGVVPRGLVAPLMQPFARPAGMRLINLAKYRSASWKGEHTFRQSHGAFSFLLDYVPGWKRIYDPGGLIQYQSFVPRERALEVHTRLLGLCRERGIVSWLGVYKRHRPDPFLMSHALDGFSFAMDFPVTSQNRTALWALCAEMDQVVLAAGGRFYLAKDLTADAQTLERAYPGLPRYRELKAQLDPGGVLTSDQARRLGI